jgi:hypothetical protein
MTASTRRLQVQRGVAVEAAQAAIPLVRPDPELTPSPRTALMPVSAFFFGGAVVAAEACRGGGGGGQVQIWGRVGGVWT